MEGLKIYFHWVKLWSHYTVTTALLLAFFYRPFGKKGLSSVLYSAGLACKTVTTQCPFCYIEQTLLWELKLFFEMQTSELFVQLYECTLIKYIPSMKSWGNKTSFSSIISPEKWKAVFIIKFSKKYQTMFFF